MREILFKGKRLDNGEWVEGYVFDNDEELERRKVFVGSLMISKYKGEACDKWSIDGTWFYEVNPETVCQYTGLTDKNGKKIFEGDIVKQRMGRICKVVFKISNGYCGFDLIPISGFECAVSLYSPFLDLEVIGNIHDK